MHIRPITRTLLATALAGAVAFGALAQSGGASAAKEKELDAARMQLQAAARRVAELSRELGRPGEGAYVFERHMLQKPALGVLLEAEGSRGVRIAGVTPDSGAAKAGLRTGDVITSIGGKAIAGATGEERLAGLRGQLADLKDGQAVQVGYERGGRAATVAVTPRKSASFTMFSPEGNTLMPHGNVRLLHGTDGALQIEADGVTVRPRPGTPLRIERGDGDGKAVERRIVRHGAGAPEGHARHVRIMSTPGVAPEVHREIIRLARDPACGGKPECRAIALAEAFRWNGLNLASIDENLGRYFGTRDGVLVVSAGPDLSGLQSGDVIRRVDGRSVATPRDVMDVLRAKPEGGSVAVDYLRDRKPGSAQVKVPKAMRVPLPPMPPMAPVPPDAPPAPPVGLVPRAPEAIAVAAVPPMPRVAPLPAPRRID